jgi:hypothetical protein
MIELVLLILSILTNGTDSTSSTECPEDYYGDGPVDDLLERGLCDELDNSEWDEWDECPENHYGDGPRDLLERPPECPDW